LHRITAINKVKFALHNTLRVRKKTEIPIIVRRHVAEKQRTSLTSLPKRKKERPDSRYNQHKPPTLTADPAYQECQTACGLASQ
jgi:hypothetical protein